MKSQRRRITPANSPSLLGSSRTEGYVAINASLFLRTIIFVDLAILIIPVGHSIIGAPLKAIEVLFALDNEPTIPAWWASVKLLIIAGLLAALTQSRQMESKHKVGLAVAALGFLVMSCDESAAIHERVQRGIDTQVLVGSLPDTYDTTVLAKFMVGLAGLAVVATIVWLVVNALRRIGTGAMAFVIGFLLLAAGAVVVDLTQEFVELAGTSAVLLTALEEVFEMSGATFMLYGALQACASASLGFRIERADHRKVKQVAPARDHDRVSPSKVGPVASA